MKRTGSIYEQQFSLDALKNGLEVFTPIGDYLPQDCIVMNSAGRTFRVQVKGTGVLIEDKRNNGGLGRYMITSASGKKVKETIDCTKVDTLAAYIEPVNAWYIIPCMDLDNAIRISLYPHNAKSKAKYERFLNNWNAFKISWIILISFWYNCHWRGVFTPQINTRECELFKRREIMADTVISEAPAESTGAEDNQAQGPMSMEDLAASFVDQVESDQQASDDEAKAEVTESSEEAEASEEDVLSQSISEEEEDTEEETEQEDEEIEEESEEEPPKAVGKLLKQVNKLTARAKSAEENADALKAEIESLKSNSQPTEQATGQPELENVQTFEDLQKLQKEAQAAKKFALQNIGKHYVEVDGKEYSDDDIRNILTQADEYLTEKIPARQNYLQEKAQWQQDTIATHPWLNQDDESAEARKELFGGLKSQYGHILKNLPNGDFVAATLVRGIEAIKSDQKAKTAPKKKAIKPKSPPPTDGGNASPPVENANIRKQKQKEAIKRKGPLSANDLAAFLSD